ncbi:MAG: hypothetical protein EG826_01260 [Deltaproteobacteria bacterium]|nr:hypothetical protein [Deltaproteobacteria bacterium]
MHIKAGMSCTDCHPLVGATKDRRLSHQIAKGTSPTGHVRDDLDGAGMKTCVSCHSGEPGQLVRRGVRAKAKNPQAAHARLLPGAVFHTYLVSCSSCHITAQPRRALTILDMSTGREQGYTADDFASVAASGDYLKPAPKPWPPWQMRTKKYQAAVPKHLQWFGERMTNGEIRPVPLHYVAKAAREVGNLTVINTRLADGKNAQQKTVVSDRDVAGMIAALAKSGFANVVFVSDKIYQMKNEKLSSLPLTQKTLYYTVEHDVTDLSQGRTYGRKGRPDGCLQCHSDAAPFFAKMDIKNVREFLKTDYPALKNPNAAPQYEMWGLRSVPAFE